MYFIRSVLQLPWAAEKYPERVVISAMRLESQSGRRHEPGQQWEAYIPQLQRSVSVEQYELEELASVLYQGRGRTLFNGEFAEKDQRKIMLDAAQNLTRLYLFSPLPEDALPLFLCEEPGLQPCQYEVKVHILFETFDQLPDVQESVGFVRVFLHRQGLLHEPTDAESREYSPVNRLRVAAQIKPFAGCYLPVETRAEASVTPGVLHLREDLGGKDFLATLYLSDGAGGLQPDARLWRSLQWRYGTRGGEEQLEIASLLSIDRAKPMTYAAS